jgi:Ca2+-binding RTX toxin-like protein
VIVGSDGRNRIRGHGGNDTCDGALGTDTAVHCEATANVP